MSSQEFKVAIDCRVTPASAGGVAQVILGLVNALGRLEDDGTRYKLVVESEAERTFLEPYIHETQEFAFKTQTFSKRLERKFKRVGTSISRHLVGASNGEVALPQSDGFLESLDCEVIHFPHQRFQKVGLPAIYNPHDLQHLHFPEFFDPTTLAQRDLVYRSGCEMSDTVVVSSRWVKEDVVSNYGLNPDKVQIIPWAPPTEAYEDPSDLQVEEVRLKHKLQPQFALYPAMTWPHKNHLRLLEGLAHLRDTRGINLNLVCTGSMLEPHATKIRALVDDLGLGPQVSFLGFLSDIELRCVYQLAQFLVMPSLFESDSSPIYEAWLEGTPIACSNVTSLPVQVMDAAVVFDPYNAASISEALGRLATDKELRQSLSALGYVRVKDYDWERTAKAYRAVYKRAARRPLSEEDRYLLSWDWMEKPVRLQGAKA